MWLVVGDGKHMQGLMKHHEEIVEYFKTRGVSAIFLFRRNLLRRMISVLANSYDRDAKLLNGTHKSHVHSPKEVSFSHSLSPSLHMSAHLAQWNLSCETNGFQAEILARYKPLINTTLLIADLKQVQEMTSKALSYFNTTRHIFLYYEDVVKNHTVRTFCFTRLILTSFIAHIVFLIFFFLFSFAETRWCARISKGPETQSKESASEDSSWSFVATRTELGTGSNDTER